MITRIRMEYEETIRQLNLQVQSGNTSMQEKDQQILKYMNMNETYKSQITNLNSQITNYSTQITQLNITIREKDDCVQSSGDESSKYMLMIKSLEDKLGRYETENANYRNEISSYKSQITNYTTIINANETSTRNAGDKYLLQIKSLESQIGGYQTEIANYRNEVSSYKSQITNYTTIINQNETSSRSSGDKYLLQIQSLEERVAGLQ